jgi:hypothetical protein
MMKLYSLSFALILLTCCNQNSRLEKALSLAGENRQELEKVLQHYSNDTLKLKAAEFLIENMTAHYSFVENKGLSDYYDEIDSLYEAAAKYSYLTRVRLYDSISAKYDRVVDFDTISDLQIVSAKYLIDNIDCSFDLWRKGEWAQHVGFDEFCEYILPYKIIDGQTLDDWKKYAYEICKSNIDSLHYCGTYKNLAYKACERVNYKLRDKLHPAISPKHDNIPIKRLNTSLKILQGTCDDYSFMATAVMRAKGIPVAIDYTSQWAYKNLGHVWNVLLDNYGKNVIFVGCDNQPGSPHKVDQKMAKTFRKTYAVNRELEELYQKEKDIPPLLNELCIKDVTSEYTEPYNVQVEIKHKTSHKYAYLAVFDNQNWTPIYWGKIKGNKVTFENMGANIVYLPVCYENNKIIPLAPPFLLTYTGEKMDITSNNQEYQTLKLYRKYFYPEHAYFLHKRTIGAEIQASNFSDFRDSIILFTVSEPAINTGKIILNQNREKYRYWRYFTPKTGSYCTISELYFFEKNNPEAIYGNVIGTEGSYKNQGNVKEKAFDKNPLTYFDSDKTAGAWVGMDFGVPVEIEKILYVPRGDGNSIILGNEYELVYWDNGQWNSLGKQIANDNFLEYKNCPTHALFLLHNLTTGLEERIFTYKNDEQIWW